MSPRVSPPIIVRQGSKTVFVRLFVGFFLSGLCLANATARAQSSLPSDGWQAVQAKPAPKAVSRISSEPTKPQSDGWRPRPTSVEPIQQVSAEEPVESVAQPVQSRSISAEAAFGDAPQPKASRSLVWQPKPDAARRYPASRTAAVQPSHPKNNRSVVRTDYEFDDPPVDNVRATHVSHANVEAIATPQPITAPEALGSPEPVRTVSPQPANPANSGMIYDEPSEVVSEDEYEGEGNVDLGESCGCCANCGHCNCLCCCRPFAGKLWVRGEYLLWWSPGYSVPALLTTSSSTNFATAGRLGDNATTTLFGNTQFAGDTRSGVRIGMGYWLMPCRDVSIEGYFTSTGTLNTTFAANSNNYPVLAIPYYNVLSNVQGQSAKLIAFPGEATGSVSINASSEFSSAEALLRKKMTDGDSYHIDFLVGYRYARLAESLQMLETQTITGPRMPFPENTLLNISDSFNTQNEFNGGQFGFAFSEQYQRWTLDVSAKMSVGNTHTQVAIGGSTVQSGVGGVSNATLAYNGGVLTQGTNIGTVVTNSVTVMPELGVKVGFFLNRRMKLSAGYNFLYWSKVARPGDQIDTTINSSQIPPGSLIGAGFPQQTNRTTDFWLQGVTAGFEYRF